MPPLSDVVSRIPGLAGYEAARLGNQQAGAQQLQQFGVLQQILQRQQAAQQEQQLSGVVQKAGGDPAKAIQALIAAGTPQSLKLAAELKVLMPKPAEPYTLSQDQVRMGADNNPVAIGLPKIAETKPIVEHNFSVGDNLVQPHISLDNGRTWNPIPGSKPSSKFAKMIPDDTPGPTADTIEMDAWRYLTDGTLPTNIGRGMQGAKQSTEIRNRAAALAKEMNMSPDEIRMAQLTNKTQVQAIGQLAKARAQILQFEKTARYNADQALVTSEKVDRTGVPVINRWLQAGRSEIAGDPDTKVFHAAMETFISEYARVMSGGYGAAQTFEGAQLRAHQLLNTSATKDQVRKVIGQLKIEMGNRVKALDDQMGEERRRLRSGIGKPQLEPAPSPQPAPAANAPKRIKFSDLPD
jgi:hypothetical protein